MTLEELKQCRAWKISIQSRKTELEQLRRDMERAKQNGGWKNMKDEQQTLELREQELTREYAQRLKSVRRIEAWIAALPGLKEAIFRLRYLDGLSWEQVARRTGYSEKQVFWIQRKTMEEDKKRQDERKEA